MRPMRSSDIEPVSKIERQSFATAWNAQAYITELANPAALYLVALLDDTVVGYGGQWVIMDEAHITTIAVLPEIRERKIGERLFCEMLRTAMEKGATRATLEVRETNDPAKKLYEKYGFKTVAARKGYYSDNNENADIMWVYDMESPEWRTLYARHRAALGM